MPSVSMDKDGLAGLFEGKSQEFTQGRFGLNPGFWLAGNCIKNSSTSGTYLFMGDGCLMRFLCIVVRDYMRPHD